MAYRDYSIAKGHIVDPSGNGDFTTITAALAAVSSGETIFITPGTYTENITLKAGVDICSFIGSQLTPNVTIVGKCSFSAAGAVSLTGIRLQTNSDFCLEVSGTATSIVYLENCFISCTNNTGVSFTSSDSGSRIKFLDCNGDISSTGISYFNSSSSGILSIFQGEWSNSANSSTPSTASSGFFYIFYAAMSVPVSATGTTTCGLEWSTFAQRAAPVLDVTFLTTSGTSNATIWDCIFDCGTATCIDVGAGSSLVVGSTNLITTNSVVVSGAGSITYDALFFRGGTGVTTTTQIPADAFLGNSVINSYTAPGQPAFAAYNSANDSNVTGDGTVYQVVCDTEIFDQGGDYDETTGLFTAPVTGKYSFLFTIAYGNLTASFTQGIESLTSSNRIWTGADCNIGAIRNVSNNASLSFAALVDMDAGDTCNPRAYVSGGTKTVAVLGGPNPDGSSFFTGHLTC